MIASVFGRTNVGLCQVSAECGHKKWIIRTKLLLLRGGGGSNRSCRVHAVVKESDGRANGDARSYLSMWKKAKERYDQEQLQQQTSNVSSEAGDSKEALEQREKEFNRILEVPREERDRVHRLQVIDRAAAALAAAEALLASRPRSPATASEKKWEEAASRGWGVKKLGDSSRRAVVVSAEPATAVINSPGPDFWSWTPPPPDSETQPAQPARASSQPAWKPSGELLVKDREASQTLDIPFETSSEPEENQRSVLPLVFQSRAAPPAPPLPSLVEVNEVKLPAVKTVKEAAPAAAPERDQLADAAVHQDLQENKTKYSTGVNPDGSRWWKETGEEDRGNGVVCSWTVTRGVSSEGVVEWEEKFWEACDDFDYKELGSEKSGRDSTGNVWRESWKEAIWQDAKSGLLHMEKSAEKWGKNGSGTQWDEKWWEHYDAAGRAEKWADKWCVIDPNTQLDPGHGHVWHERWGEEFDGEGGAMKYTDKWAERAEFGSWTKWGDKWDERFDKNGIGKKQGETWWAGASGERWNKTWGEQHNGTGWVHKYGQSSSGEHWDTHEEQETWYEKHPHFGFHHCMENSQQLQKVSKKKKRRL